MTLSKSQLALTAIFAGVCFVGLAAIAYFIEGGPIFVPFVVYVASIIVIFSLFRYISFDGDARFVFIVPILFAILAFLLMPPPYFFQCGLFSCGYVTWFQNYLVDDHNYNLIKAQSIDVTNPSAFLITIWFFVLSIVALFGRQHNIARRERLQ